MNDLYHACESWSERISLSAAGCLAADEEAELRRHLAACSDCREHFRQLAGLCGALAELRAPRLARRIWLFSGPCRLSRR